MTKSFAGSVAKKRPATPPVTKSNNKELVRCVLKDVTNLASTWKDRLPRHSATPPTTIRVASDCAGYGSDVIALRLLGLHQRVRFVMISETSKSKQLLHHAVSKACGVSAKHASLTTDLMKRDDLTAPGSDLYVAGYPCPSWSKLGKLKGAMDERGCVFLKGMKYIAAQRPRLVVLEQVSSMLHHRFAKVWGFVKKTLALLDYNVCFGVLNTKDHGIPQSRPRLYLLAVARESSAAAPLKLPPPRRGPPPPLQDFLDTGILGKGNDSVDLEGYKAKLGKKMKQKFFVLDIGSSKRFQHAVEDLCPCLTKTRLQGRGYWVTKVNRRLLLSEAARLQGVPRAVVLAMQNKANTKSLSAGVVQGAFGDAMSINVLCAVLGSGLRGANLIEQNACSHPHWSVVPLSEASRLSDVLFQKHAVPTAGNTK